MAEKRELWRLSACEVVDLLSQGVVSPLELLDTLERRIAEVDQTFNALPTLCFDRARKATETLPPNSILQGLPVAIKDLTPVAGVRTTFGSAIYSNNVPQQSSELVTQIEESGGVVYAKSNTPEFGAGGISFNDVFNSTRSPLNPRYSSGGSSGGAAAALASGCAWLAHGSDMAGSLRTPAAFCGVSSLRPSPGRVRTVSLDAPYSVLGAEGPMARSIEDVGLFADAMFSGSAESMRQAANTPTRPARIAVSYNLGITSIDSDVIGRFGNFVEKLKAADIEVVEAEPDFTGVHEAFDTLRAHEFAIGLEQELNLHPGVMKPEVEWNVRHGLSLDTSHLRKAKRLQGAIIDRARKFMDEFDLLICPATSVSCVEADLRYPGSDGAVAVPEYYRWLAIAYATTMTSLPVVTLPVDRFDHGLSLGVQLIGKLWQEPELLHFARSIEQLAGFGNAPQ